MTAPTMHTEFGIYVDGEWHVWLPAKTVEGHGWKSAADAVAYWKHPDRDTKFVAYMNGRETPWGQNTGGVEAGTGPIIQRVWFDHDPEEGQLAFDLEAVTA